MTRPRLRFDGNLCGGCLSCQTTCAQRNEDASGLVNARLRVALRPLTGDHELTYCRQCNPALCAEACPVGAIVFVAGGETGRGRIDGREIDRGEGRDGSYWDVDYELCVGCNACLSACPFGAMLYDPVGEKVVKCHTCRGEPACTAACPTGALTWAVGVGG